MDTFLTLVIALGGIATGIGAIWAAVAARRQAQISERQAQLTEQSLAEQRRAFREQTEIASRQAQVTERSLAEQNERARLSLEVDLMYKLEERFDSPRFRNLRRRHVTYLKENCFVDDRIVGVQRLDASTAQLFDFFEGVGYLTRAGVLPLDQVWSQWSGLLSDWALCEPAIKRLREERNDPALFQELENLHRRMVDYERQRTGRSEPPTKEELRQFVERNLHYVGAMVGEEPFAGDEKPAKG